MDRAPGTVYMNRQTGMTMYQEHPGSMPNMTGMNSRPPPGYNASSVGSPYIPSGNFHFVRASVPERLALPASNVAVGSVFNLKFVFFMYFL